MKMKKKWTDPPLYPFTFIALKQSFGKVMFSDACVCPQGGVGYPGHMVSYPPGYGNWIKYHPWSLNIFPPDMGSGYPTPPPDIWWWQLEKCFKLFTWGPSPSSNWYWHLVAVTCWQEGGTHPTEMLSSFYRRFMNSTYHCIQMIGVFPTFDQCNNYNYHWYPGYNSYDDSTNQGHSSFTWMIQFMFTILRFEWP